MTIKRGVSLYSYQQTQFLKQLDLEGQIREVGENLGAEGIELIDEMSLHYPDPGHEFIARWHAWMDQYGTRPVALDVGMDVLQFRDHVMTYEECAERLIRDISLAKSLGFSIVRVMSIVPIEIIEMALPHAEKLDIKLGKEIHQPMRLEGPVVAEIVELAQRTSIDRVGIVPDLGIFQFQLSEAQLKSFGRKGAQQSAQDASTTLALAIRDGEADFDHTVLFEHTAGNVRAEFNRFLAGNAPSEDLRDPFEGVRRWADERVEDPQTLDYTVVAEALLFSNTSADKLRELAPYVTHVHAKFNHMSLVPGTRNQYEDAAIDYPAAIGALKDGGFDGYLNSEYEGQRYWQDLEIEGLQDEVEQVRRHQSMLRRLIET
ncbi:sugar phosphate isomerase/epimerase family protein [Microbacterium sp. B2969]|uniref:Sugar phosphate isomerase/epimerase family protein n=1 Tax=Microbacterium alkaliflavum TaxID=3248839 RepID=A0ABW7QE49_9MICO